MEGRNNVGECGKGSLELVEEVVNAMFLQIYGKCSMTSWWEQGNTFCKYFSHDLVVVIYLRTI